MLEHEPNLVVATLEQAHFIPRIHSPVNQFQARRKGALPGNREPLPELLLLLRRERSADVLRLRQRLVILADEMPKLELLQDSAEDADLDVCCWT